MVPATAAADVERISGDGLVPAVRWSGTNRYDTAALIATDGGAEAPVFTGDTVVIARGDAFPDGLAGSFLAGMVDAPVLLTAPDSLPDATEAALDELDPNRIIILGGRGAISNDVENALRAGRRGISIVRHSGPDRFETAADIAAAGARAGEIGMYNGMATAILVTGERPADALTAGPLAAAEGFPVFLTHQGHLPAAAAETMGDLGIQHVLIVGGEAAVGASVADAVTDLGITVERLSGTTRETTAMDVAEFARDQLGWTLNEIHFAGAADRAFPDSLALAPRSALSESPILLLGEVGPSGPVREFLRGLDAVDAVAVAGGGAAVSPRALANARTGLAVQAAGLAFPRGMTTGADGAVYVAEVGFGGDECVGEGEEQICFGLSGSVTRILNGEQTRPYQGLPSINIGAGIADVAFDAAGNLVAPIGLGVPADQRDAIAQNVEVASNFGTLARITETGAEPFADLAQWEFDNNADDATPETSLDPPLNSNPFSVARDETAGVWVVADAGGNSLLQVDDAGTISLLAAFPQVQTDEGSAQYVPTSVVVGPDGAYYVGGLGGEIPGAANIYRYDPVTEDLTVEEEGFTFVLDLGFDDAGNLYVLQAVPTEPLSEEDPGVVIQVAPNGERSELGGGGLVFPVGLEVTAEGLYVSHCPFCPTGGEVLQLQATAPLG